jgi:hypothetical protein
VFLLEIGIRSQIFLDLDLLGLRDIQKVRVIDMLEIPAVNFEPLHLRNGNRITELSEKESTHFSLEKESVIC